MNFLVGQFFLALIWWRMKSTSANILLNPQTNTDRILRISTAHFAPYMYQNENGRFYNGMEFRLLQVIADRLNLSLSFQTTSKRSDICVNVAMNVSDICIGGIFPHENSLQHTTMSVTYAGDELTWCVRRAGIMPMYLAQMIFMNPETWLLIVFGYGYTSGFLLYLLIQFDIKFEQRNNRDWHYLTWLVALPACLGISPNFRPVSGTTRIFFGLMLISAFFFFQILFTRINDFLFKQIPWHQVSSFEEIIDKNFDLAGTQEAFNVLQGSKKISDYKIESFGICEDIGECLLQLLSSYKFAIGGSRENILSSPFYSPSKVFCFKDLENIAGYPVTLYMQKDFYLKDKINEIIGQMLDGGFFDKLKSDCYFHGQFELPYQYGIQLQLSITHISGALLFFFGVGSLLSTSTFIFENLIFWKMNLGVKSKIWIYFEHFVDGKRHYLKNLPGRLEQQNKHSQINFPYLE